MASFNEIKLKVDRGEFTVIPRRSRSEVYDIFYDIKDSNGELIKNVLQCTRCKNVYKSSTKWTSNLLRHHCYKKYKAGKEEQIVKVQPTNDLKSKCMELVVHWVVGNSRPFNIGNDEGLYKLAEFFINTGHKFGRSLDVNNLIPHSSMVAKNITKIYDDQREILKEELHSIKNIGLSISCNLWRHNCEQTLYVGATVHYFKAGSIAHKILGMREMDSDGNTGCNIRNKIVHILREFDCELNQMVTVVSNMESNMKEAFQHDRSVVCINHLLNNVLEVAVNDTSEVNSIATTCSKLVKYLMKSDVNSVLNANLESCTATRWNTSFSMLKSVQQNWNDITQTLQEKTMTSRLGNLTLADINDILEVLNPFEEALRLLGGENYPTIHHVYPQIRNLKTMINKSHPMETEMMKQFKENLIFNIESVIDPNITYLHQIALFLFPPANKLHNFTDKEKCSIHEKCKEMLIAYENYRSNSEILMEYTEADADTDTDAFNDFVQSSCSPNYEDEVSAEICRYERQTVLYYKQFDPLQWWETNKREYPLLYRLSSFVLATPASSAISERHFSKAPRLLSESVLERNTIGVNQIIFLNSNLYLNAPCANLGSGVEPKQLDSDSDPEYIRCSPPTPTINKCSTPTP